MTGGHLTDKTTGDNRRIVVLGATGQQGGAVATALLDAGWRVRAVVREPSSPRSRALAAAGVDVVTGDLADPESLHAAFSGAYGVFSVQPSSGQAGAVLTDDDEVAFGTSVATVAYAQGVGHLIYSSAIAAGSTDTGIAHFDTKRRIEAHIRTLDMASTIVRPATFMEILTSPGMGLAHDEFSFLMANDQPMQFIAVRDIGLIVADIFAAPLGYLSRTLDLAGDVLTGDQLAHCFSNALGRPVLYSQINPEVLAHNELLAQLVAAVDDGRLAGRADLVVLHSRFPFLLSFEQWLAGPGASSIATALQEATTDITLR